MFENMAEENKRKPSKLIIAINLIRSESMAKLPPTIFLIS
jgi:hypothetical protein